MHKYPCSMQLYEAHNANCTRNLKHHFCTRKRADLPTLYLHCIIKLALASPSDTTIPFSTSQGMTLLEPLSSGASVTILILSSEEYVDIISSSDSSSSCT